MRPSRLARLQGGLGAAALALFLGAALPQAVSRAWAMLSLAAVTAPHETFDAARLRFFGPAYVAAIEAIRQEVPADQPYLLVEGGRPRDGNLYWVRFDLAPRRALYLGRLDQLTARRLRQHPPVRVPNVVIAYGRGEAPRLLERYRFVQEIERRGGGEPDLPPGP